MPKRKLLTVVLHVQTVVSAMERSASLATLLARNAKVVRLMTVPCVPPDRTRSMVDVFLLVAMAFVRVVG